MQNQQQTWSDKALLTVKRYIPWSEKLIVLFTTSRLLVCMLNSLWSTATVTSNQVNTIIFCLCFFRQLSVLAKGGLVRIWISQKDFRRQRIHTSNTAQNIMIYCMYCIFFFLIFARSRKDLVIGTISKIVTHDRHGFITFFQNNNHKD